LLFRGKRGRSRRFLLWEERREGVFPIATSPRREEWGKGKGEFLAYPEKQKLFRYLCSTRKDEAPRRPLPRRSEGKRGKK